jgi:hypothetical protein
MDLAQNLLQERWRRQSPLFVRLLLPQPSLKGRFAKIRFQQADRFDVGPSYTVPWWRPSRYRDLHNHLTPPDGRQVADAPARNELVAATADGAIFESHGISPRARAALMDRDADAFLTERKSSIERAVRIMCDRLASWGANDRPSIDFLLQGTETA